MGKTTRSFTIEPSRCSSSQRLTLGAKISTYLSFLQIQHIQHNQTPAIQRMHQHVHLASLSWLLTDQSSHSQLSVYFFWTNVCNDTGWHRNIGSLRFSFSRSWVDQWFFLSWRVKSHGGFMVWRSVRQHRSTKIHVSTVTWYGQFAAYCSYARAEFGITEHSNRRMFLWPKHSPVVKLRTEVVCLAPVFCQPGLNPSAKICRNLSRAGQASKSTDKHHVHQNTQVIMNTIPSFFITWLHIVKSKNKQEPLPLQSLQIRSAKFTCFVASQISSVMPSPVLGQRSTEQSP